MAPPPPYFENTMGVTKLHPQKFLLRKIPPLFPFQVVPFFLHILGEKAFSVLSLGHPLRVDIHLLRSVLVGKVQIAFRNHQKFLFSPNLLAPQCRSTVSMFFFIRP